MKSPANGQLTGSFDGECIATRETLDRVGDKWSVLVVAMLGDAPVRFGALRRAIGGISQRVLTATLRALERDGLVTRTVHPTRPPQVDYVLTPLGRSLLGPVSAVADWAQRHRAEVQRARGAFDREKDGISTEADPTELGRLSGEISDPTR